MRTKTILAGAALVCATATTAPAADVAKSADDIRPLLVGTSVPELQVPDVHGGVVDLAVEAKAQPTILIFYRGGW